MDFNDFGAHLAADKGTLTTFSDSELLRKVQFPAPKISSETVPKPIVQTGLPAENQFTVSWTNITCSLPVIRGIARLSSAKNKKASKHPKVSFRRLPKNIVRPYAGTRSLVIRLAKTNEREG